MGEEESSGVAYGMEEKAVVLEAVSNGARGVWATERKGQTGAGGGRSCGYLVFETF